MRNVHFWASTLTDSNIESLYINERDRTFIVGPNQIRLSGFRGVSKGSVSVPSSGSISINSHFKGKTFEGSSVAPTLSVITQTSWNYWDQVLLLILMLERLQMVLHMMERIIQQGN